jgi:hypothetical protein
MERNDAQVNFDWGTSTPDANLREDNFSVSWTGFINLPSAGDWRLGATSDDGFAVELELTPGGGLTPVFSDWNDHASRTAWGSIYNLTAGWHQIRVQHYENSDGAVAQLLFEGPGVTAQIVPSANLRTCSSPCSTTAPSGLNATAITATSAQLNWTPGTGGTKQQVRLDTDQADVDSGCPGGEGSGAGQCLLKDDNVASGQNSCGTGGSRKPRGLAMRSQALSQRAFRRVG